MPQEARPPQRLSPAGGAPPEAGQLPSEGWYPWVFVGAAWLGMTAAALGLVARYGSPIPYVDDWAHVPIFCRAGPPDLGWMWDQHNEHRFPVTKLVMWCSWKLTGGDPRGCMFLSVGAASLATLGLIMAARRLRGRISYADAFFPFLMLHWGHAVNWLWSVQLFFVGAAVLVCALLIFLVLPSHERRLWVALAGGVALVILPLHGAMGVAFTPALALAVGLEGLRLVRAAGPGEKRNGAIMIAAAAAAVAMIGLYLAGFHLIAKHGRLQADPVGVFLRAVECAAGGLGSLGTRAWPASGAGVVGLTLLTLWILWRAWKTRPDQRGGTLVLALGLAAAWSVPVAIAIGRHESATSAPRYGILAAPVFCATYLIWCRYGRPATARFVHMVLFCAVCAFSSYHMSLGTELGKERRAATERFRQDVADGIPMTGLVGRHAPYWCWDEAPLARGLTALREAGVGLFAPIAGDPPMESRSLPLAPAETRQITRHEDAWAGTGLSSGLVFRLPQSRRVYAVRLRFSMHNEDDTQTAEFRVLWPPGHVADPARPYRVAAHRLKLKTGPVIRTQTVWIDDTIDRFEIRPGDRPFVFRLDEVSVLGPPEGSRSISAPHAAREVRSPDRLEAPRHAER